MKHIFTSMASLIAKIAVFDVISEKQMHPQCVTNVDFGQEASSDHIFLRTRLVKATTVNGARYRDNTVLSAEIG